MTKPILRWELLWLRLDCSAHITNLKHFGKQFKNTFNQVQGFNGHAAVQGRGDHGGI